MGGLWGGTFERNAVDGLWDMNGTLAAHWACQPALVASGFAVGAAPGPHFQPSGPAPAWLALGSAVAPFGGLKPWESLVLVNPAGPNGFPAATGTHEWTLVMDVRFLSYPPWTAVLQTNPSNAGDAEIFLDAAGSLQFIGAAPSTLGSGPLALNVWHRLAFRAHFDGAAGDQVLRAYLNGVPTAQTAGAGVRSAVNGRYALAPQVLLFADDNDETARVDLGAVAFWGRALDDADIAQIGAHDPGGIGWPGQVAPGGCPPLPELTGVLRFGNATAQFVPDTAALAASAVPPSLPGTVAQVQVPLGAAGGWLTGFPDHRIGGTLTGHVSPQGDIVVTDPVAVQFTGAGPDIATLAGVQLVRQGITLGPAGAVAGQLKLYFPAGLGVALEPLGKNTLVRAVRGAVPLDPSLNPADPMELVRSDFTSDLTSTTLYPMLDRVPVRFATPSILYTPSAGRFSFIAAAPPVFHREPQLAILFNQIVNQHPGAEIPASNDFPFLAARETLGAIRVGTRPGGAAAVVSLSLALDPQKFGGTGTTVWMHHPALSVTWSQASESRFSIFNDSVDEQSSGLRGAGESVSWYAQGVASVGCEGEAEADPVPTEEMRFIPDDAEWRFTRDGGLRAEGAATGGASNPGALTVEWGAYLQGTTTQYAHRIVTPFPAARVLTAGLAVRADQLAPVAAGAQPAALLLSGLGAPGDEGRVERPGTPAYLEGLSDYAGVNLRCTPGTFQAVSRLADQPTPAYALASAAKYYLRPGGVTGRHLTAPGAPNIQFTAYGSSFTLSALNLSFLDGVNLASGVNGSLQVPPPADFSLAFKSLTFGGQGQLQQATIFTPQADKVLGKNYWGLQFTPLSLDFPQPQVCPAPGPGTGFIRILARAAVTGLSSQPMTGNLALLNGNLVTEADTVGIGHSPLSRFAPGPQVALAGPENGPPWIVHPVSQVSLNKHPNTPTVTEPGGATLAGLMDVPFFTDLPVVLSTNANNQITPAPEVYVRQPWSALASTPHDPAHAGAPAGVSLMAFRTTPAWDPHATREWQGILSLDLPVHLQANRVFRSRTPVDGDVVLFHLNQAVRSMTPTVAELTFDGSVTADISALIPQVNVAKLLQDVGLLPLQADLVAAVTGALEMVVSLDALLADHLQTVLAPGLAVTAGHQVTPEFFAALAAAADRGAKLDSLGGGLTADVVALLGGGSSGLNGHWRRDFLARVTQARQGMQAAQALVASASNFKKLGGAIGTVIGLAVPPGDPDAQQLGALQSAFAQVVARLQGIETALTPGGELTAALAAAFGGGTGAGPLVGKALEDLKSKWAAPGAGGDALYGSATAAMLAADLTASLTDRMAGSAFAGAAGALLRQHAGDAQTLGRQALDDTLHAAEHLVSAALNDAANAPISKALGTAGPNETPLGGYLAAARLRGYGRLNGDTLQELRLDGETRLKVPDEMKFEAWFLLRQVDSTTPGGACLAAGGAAAEIAMGGGGKLKWAGKTTSLSAGGKVALSASGQPVALSGDFSFHGDFDFSEVAVNDVKLGFGFGANNGYVYGRGAGAISSMSVEAGVFVGQTCDTAVIGHADEDIGSLLNTVLPGFSLPVKGALVYAEGGMSLMPIIGIPPSCVLDLRVHGGQGYFGFFNGSGQVVAGVKQLQGLSGELLCLVDASGKLATVMAGVGSVSGGSPHLSSLNGVTTAKMKGTVGVGWFSYTFTKKLGFNVKAAPLKYSIDY
jgi:hypothetical protein